MINPAELLFLFCIFSLGAGQGQRCSLPSDCTSEYAPYCSKWGWCVWTSLYGDQGPPQSFGAEEDGERGQCRGDSDCTQWAAICSPLGYCRSGFWDGSFGSPSNPRPGQEPSDWIKKNSGTPATSTKNKPEPTGRETSKSEGSTAGSNSPGSTAGSSSRVSTAGSSSRGSTAGSNSRGSTAGSSSRVSTAGSSSPGSTAGSSSHRPSSNPRSKTGASSPLKAVYEDDIKAGKIPGRPGLDYPNYSLSSLRGKHGSIELAPPDKIPKDYPSHPPQGGTGGTGGVGGAGGAGGTGGVGGAAKEGECPGTLESCMEICPSEIKIFRVCVNSCSKRCA